jgi:hypothetical protein
MMAFHGGHPPGPNAGEISPQTEALRPLIQLPDKQCKAARRLRRKGWEVPEIAKRFNTSENDVWLAIATMRTSKPLSTRATLNVTVEARDFVLSEAEDHEACWETLDRLLVELAFRRAMAGAPVAQGG